MDELGQQTEINNKHIDEVRTKSETVSKPSGLTRLWNRLRGQPEHALKTEAKTNLENVSAMQNGLIQGKSELENTYAANEARRSAIKTELTKLKEELAVKMKERQPGAVEDSLNRTRLILNPDAVNSNDQPGNREQSTE